MLPLAAILSIAVLIVASPSSVVTSVSGVIGVGRAAVVGTAAPCEDRGAVSARASKYFAMLRCRVLPVLLAGRRSTSCSRRRRSWGRFVVILRHLPVVARFVRGEHRHEHGRRIAEADAGVGRAALGRRVIDIVGIGTRLDAALPGGEWPDRCRYSRIRRSRPSAGAVVALARADTHLLPVTTRSWLGDHLHVAIERKAAEQLAFSRRPSRLPFLYQMPPICSACLFGVSQRRPVEILVMDRRKTLDVHPGAPAFSGPTLTKPRRGPARTAPALPPA